MSHSEASCKFLTADRLKPLYFEHDSSHRSPMYCDLTNGRQYVHGHGCMFCRPMPIFEQHLPDKSDESSLYHDGIFFRSPFSCLNRLLASTPLPSSRAPLQRGVSEKDSLRLFYLDITWFSGRSSLRGIRRASLGGQKDIKRLDIVVDFSNQ